MHIGAVFKMRFFDINTMIGRWSFNDLAFEKADELIHEMDRLHIERAFVFHSLSQCYDPAPGNDALYNEIKGNDRLIGTMVLTPLIRAEFGGREKVIRFMKEKRIGAVRIYPIDHSFMLDVWNMEELFDLTSEYTIPVLLDMRQHGGELSSQYDKIYELAAHFPKTPLVLLTTGYRHMRITLRLLEKCQNVFLDTSTFITYRGIEEVIRLFGSKRILFGSRMPFIEGGVSVGRVIYADISDTDKENIAYKNAMDLLSGNQIYSGEVQA
jgi:predicted TIM-barrel fold metal-dependent hydrolase